MSRCYCCDRILSTAEACAKFKGSGEYTEMCNVCIKASDLQGKVVKRKATYEEEEDDLDEYDSGVAESESDDGFSYDEEED